MILIIIKEQRIFKQEVLELLYFSHFKKKVILYSCETIVLIIHFEWMDSLICYYENVTVFLYEYYL